ncbi:MFS transporter [Corticibacterium sp. UT-5YL-CI-8]|nr:MFS transporter [Tianweitania sp. UT-5YL-CI-8]
MNAEPSNDLDRQSRRRFGYRESSIRPGLLFPLIVASALFMEHVDTSALAVALPTIAEHFNRSPIDMRVILTAYLLALAVTLPISGWMADRFGARTIFRLAVVLFIAGSIFCGFATSVTAIVIGRIVEGIGGAMMVPVGRLIILRALPKSELVNAFAWVTIPGLLGPIIGPILGGFITTYFDWHWVFWINVPFAVFSFILVTLYIPDSRPAERRGFDFLGFVTIGLGLALIVASSTALGSSALHETIILAMFFSGAALLALYAITSRNRANAVIDLKLFRIRSFSCAAIGGTLFRMGNGAVPFLLPTLLQLGLGMSAFKAGSISFSAAAGALAMKFVAPWLLRKLGYRTVLICNSVISAGLIASPAIFRDWTPVWFMVGCLLMSGFFRSVNFTASNTLSYADVDTARMSRATSVVAVIQQLAAGFGITVGALALHYTVGDTSNLSNPVSFAPAFLLIGCIAALAFIPYLFLERDAGHELSGHNSRK